MLSYTQLEDKVLKLSYEEAVKKLAVDSGFRTDVCKLWAEWLGRLSPNSVLAQSINDRIYHGSLPNRDG